jgi:serine O-acetyltransferase
MVSEQSRSTSVASRLFQDASGSRTGLRRVAGAVLTVRGLATTLFRLSQVLGHVQSGLGHAVKQVNHVVTGADLAWQAEVGPGLCLYHPTGVVIGPGVRVGSRCELQQGVTIGGLGGPEGSRPDAPSPTLGDDIVVGAGARILGPITLGDGCRVGANAVVIRSAAAGETLVGVPASPVGRSARE